MNLIHILTVLFSAAKSYLVDYRVLGFRNKTSGVLIIRLRTFSGKRLADSYKRQFSHKHSYAVIHVVLDF